MRVKDVFGVRNGGKVSGLVDASTGGGGARALPQHHTPNAASYGTLWHTIAYHNTLDITTRSTPLLHSGMGRM